MVHMRAQVNVMDSLTKTIVINHYLETQLSEEQQLKFAKNVIALVADGTIKPLTGSTPMCLSIVN